MNDIYQLLAPINTGLAKSYSDDRDNNSVSVKDNKRIINFTPLLKCWNIFSKFLYVINQHYQRGK